jgi:hypothetical protein
MFHPVITIALLVFFAWPGFAQNPPASAPAEPPAAHSKRKRMVTVLPLKPLDVAMDEASLVELQFRKELAALKQIAVQSKSETELYLEQARQVNQFCDPSLKDCLVRLGNLVGVTKLIYGALSPGENGGLVLQVQLVDVPSQVLERQAREVIPADVAGKQESLKRLAVKLLAPHEALGRLSILVPVAGARVFVDGVEVGLAPLPAPLRNLNAGRHRVQVFAPPLVPFDDFVQVTSGKTAKLQLFRQENKLTDQKAPTVTATMVQVGAEEPPRSPSRLSPTLMGIGGVTAGVGLATAGVGGLVYFLNREVFNPSEDLVQSDGAATVRTRAEDTRTTMGILFGVGAGLGVVGAGIAGAGLLIE